MISLLLLYKIFQLFIFMLLGFILVKTGVVDSDDSKALSKISLYLLMPSVIINSFDVSVTNEVVQGLIVSFASAIAIHIIFFAIDVGYKRLLCGTNVERASIMYPNAGNLIIPIVSFLLGEEWLIYTCAFISVQMFFYGHMEYCFFQMIKSLISRK
ncbi:MAG: AEC family transporter [Clostridia bacterium]|nr:AEC family transporter [Clostridia bacterium]